LQRGGGAELGRGQRLQRLNAQRMRCEMEPMAAPFIADHSVVILNSPRIADDHQFNCAVQASRVDSLLVVQSVTS